MANPTTFPGDVVIPGNCRVSGNITPEQDRTTLLSPTANAQFTIPWSYWRTWDDLTAVPSAGAADDLGLITGTFATDSPSLQTGDLKAAGATTRYLRCQFPLPWSYETGQTVTLRFHAGMVTTVSDGTATLDVQCYETDEEVGISADICATTAQSINSLTFADIDFTITPTSLTAGDLLDFRIAIAVNDGATGTAVIGCVGAAKLLCDVR